jgi:hypothetical protein
MWSFGEKESELFPQAGALAFFVWPVCFFEQARRGALSATVFLEPAHPGRVPSP